MNPSSTEWTFCDGSKKRLEEMSEQELVDALRAIALVKAANEMVKDRLPGGSVPLLENFRGLRLDQRKSLLKAELSRRHFQERQEGIDRLMDGLKGVTLELKQEAIAHDTLAGKYKVASIAIRLEKICKEIDAELRRQGLS